MLALFTAIMPLSIPLTKTEIEDAKNGNVKSFNYHLNQSGLLFGTLYSLQERILKGNVLVKLVLGDNSDKYEVSEEGNSTLENNANTLAIYVLKGFVRINLKDGAEGKGKITEDDYICSKAAGDVGGDGCGAKSTDEVGRLGLLGELEVCGEQITVLGFQAVTQLLHGVGVDQSAGGLSLGVNGRGDLAGVAVVLGPDGVNVAVGLAAAILRRETVLRNLHAEAVKPIEHGGVLGVKTVAQAVLDASNAVF